MIDENDDVIGCDPFDNNESTGNQQPVHRVIPTADAKEMKLLEDLYAKAYSNYLGKQVALEEASLVFKRAERAMKKAATNWSSKLQLNLKIE